MVRNDNLERIMRAGRPEPTPAFSNALRRALDTLPQRKKKFLPRFVPVSAVAVAAFAAFCVFIVHYAGQANGPGNPPASVGSETVRPTFTAGDITPSATPASTPALIREDTAIASPEDIRDAYIAALTMRSDGQADIVFDFVDWLGGDDAKAQYALDHPGATDADMEEAGLLEVGYIRNKSASAFTYHTGPATKYYLPGEDDDNFRRVEVDFTEFYRRMTAALADGQTAFLKFVKISAEGDALVKIEWNYLP
jgi:hypothetical protein